MLNEEIQKFESLTGKNANDFSIAYVGGYLDGYEKGKSEYMSPVLDPSFITDLRDIKDWQICGYRVEDLVRLSLILRDKGIDEINLKDFNEALMIGYLKANEDFNKSIEDTVSKIINDDKEAADNGSQNTI